MKKFLATILTLTMMLTMVSVFASETVDTVELPTATVTELDVEKLKTDKDVELTYALNFTADEPTPEQLEAYGNWYADFVLTVNKDVTFNADKTADGYLAGFYEGWNLGWSDEPTDEWLSVPFENCSLAANEELRIMEKAADMMGKDSLQFTYAQILEGVKSFDCGVYFTDEFLKNNLDLKVTLKLRIYNPNPERDESHTIGEVKEFNLEDVEKPEAIVTMLDIKKLAADENDPIDLTYALNFATSDITQKQRVVYGDWYADFELTIATQNPYVNIAVEDCYLAGRYEEYSNNAWVSVPFSMCELEANKPIRIMQKAAEMQGNDDLKVTCKDVYNFVKSFDCGVYYSPEFLKANEGLITTLVLRIYNPENEEEAYTIGKAYEFKAVKTEDKVVVQGTQITEESVSIQDVNVEDVQKEEGKENVTVTIDTNVIVQKPDEGESESASVSINEVSIPADVVSKVTDLTKDDAEAEAELKIVLANSEAGDTEVIINQAALEAIKADAAVVDADTSNLAIKVEKAEENDEDLEDEQNDTVSTLENNNAVVYKISIVTDSGEPVYTEDSNINDGREIQIKIPYEKDSLLGSVVVKFLNDQGNLIDVPFTYDNGFIIIELAHFSEYVIYQEGSSSSSPSGGGGGSVEKFEVSFESNGGSAVATQKIAKNQTARKPVMPVKDGFVFEGWYTDKELTKPYVFETKITKDIVLYAKWIEKTASGNEDKDEVPVVDGLFADVKSGDWFYDDVKYVKDNGLMNGVTVTEFAPEALLTRAMLVTILYRNEGEPAVNRSIPFADIDLAQYYGNAVIWAQQNGIVNGVTENEFAPDANITREQIAAIIKRYAEYKQMDVSAGADIQIANYDDFGAINQYAISSMKYAIGSGLLKGRTERTLNPRDNATRAEVAAILHRFIEANK